MAQILICRSCGARLSAELAVNEQELANVGMLERRCSACARITAWGLAQDYRRTDRRRGERRRGQRRTASLSPPGDQDRRGPTDRRIGDMRKGQRRR
jgi:hypothetical protein